MTQETSQTKMSALYWTGGGMSINRVIDGSTKKKPNKQGHKRGDCLKIEKRHKWVTYLIKQQELTITNTYNKDRLKKIKNKQKEIIYGHICHRDVTGSISTMLLNRLGAISDWRQKKIDARTFQVGTYPIST
jgi:hypothetical protein